MHGKVQRCAGRACGQLRGHRPEMSFTVNVAEIPPQVRYAFSLTHTKMLSIHSAVKCVWSQYCFLLNSKKIVVVDYEVTSCNLRVCMVSRK